MTRWARIGGVLALLAIPVGGCNYFRPAQPEAPTTPPFSADYTSPEATLLTMQQAIQDKARTIGFTAYGDCFADSTSSSTPAYYQFFAPLDSTDWIQQGRTVPLWTLRLERNFYIRFVALRGDDYELDLAPDNDNPDNEGTGDVATLHRHYLVQTKKDTTTVTTTLAIGYADLTFARLTDGSWRIVRWIDRRDPNANPQDPEQVSLGRRRLNTQ